MANRLSPLQQALLEAFFKREPPFFLTGGAALAGYHLGHRVTEDLDLFSTRAALEEGEACLRAAAEECRASPERLQTGPYLRRWIVKRGDEGVVVDLIHDPAPQIEPHKARSGFVALDSPREIFANKLSALLGRSELRDLADLCALEAAGQKLDQGVRDAAGKDGGFSPSQLAWVLEQFQIADDAPVIAAMAPAQLRRYAADLRDRLLVLATPAPA